ncbi:MAG: hypothetical protein M1457_01105 [bacterium]|nr:hypothetical protein [bacterium]
MQSNTLRSRSFWTGLAMMVTGVGMIVAGDVSTGIQTVAGGLVTIFVRDAISKLAPGGDPSAAGK